VRRSARRAKALTLALALAFSIETTAICPQSA
jgi:hypothetical protein